MESVLLGIGAFVSWILMCALGLFLATVFSVVVAKKLEHYLVITDRWTFWMWIVTLAVCPGIAFGGNWVIWGMFLPEKYYEVVRLGWLSAGLSLAVAMVVFMFVPREKQEEEWSELAMLAGALLVDLGCCLLLILHYGAVTGFMRNLY